MQDIPEVAAKPDGRPDDEPEMGAPGTVEQAAAGALGLEDQLRKAEAQAREHQEAWLRAKAEADNIRKRAETEIKGAHKFAVERLASELLPVKDSLEAAIAAENATTESMKSGVQITLKQLASAFDRFSIMEVNPVGQKFDPHRHQAISTQESSAEPNTVLQVLQKGYLLHERVVRPALVIVAKAVEK
jgi:molecular chaperone GrpE